MKTLLLNEDKQKETIPQFSPVFAGGGILLNACQNEEDTINPIPEETVQHQHAHEAVATPPETETEQVYLTQEDLARMTKLGKQLENPYSVENMQKAAANLIAEGELPNDVEITATHLYLKFKPKDDAEYGIIQKDTTLELYTYPLDYEIVEGGDFYHDPSLPVTQPTYQYCAVPIDKVLPEGVEYEVLAELFIPEELGEDSNRRTATFPYTDALVEEALLMTGNLEKEKQKGERRSRWRPRGIIRTWDDNFARFLPLQGVKVRATRWFTTHTGITGADGRFTCDGTFKRPADYSIKWERHEFSIRSGNIGQATFRNSNRRGDWEMDIRGGTQEFYATIFRAAHHYYYENIQGLRRPPQNNFWTGQMKIGAMNEAQLSPAGVFGAWRRFYRTSPNIKIWNPNDPSMELYATTIHELCHASHWNMDNTSYNNAQPIVRESWARGVQWALTRMIYPDYQGGTNRTGLYTHVVVDMIDGRAPLDIFGRPIDINNGSENLTEDDVTGYTIRQIEDALNGNTVWNAWRDNIKRRYANSTENNLDALFNHWN